MSPDHGPVAPRTLRRREVLLAVAVGIAFADSSIVVLALPDLYGEFSTSIEGLAWIITGYNVAVAALALALVPLAHRIPARGMLVVGLALFAAASLACGAAWSLDALIALRVVQGIGGALLLSASLPAMRALTHRGDRAGRIWRTAGTAGAVLGPAVGGTVTQLLDWRAIFIIQAPFALAAVFALPAAADMPPPGTAREGLRGTLTANTGLLFVFGALVGALFLAVVVVVTVWGYSPIAGAAVVSTLPVATVAVGRLAPLLGVRGAAAGGALLLAAGLSSLALLPSADPLLAAASLALCGAGVGLSVPAMSLGAIAPGSAGVRSGAFTIGARHLGLVLALAIVAPVLASDLDTAADRAVLSGTAVVLDAPVPLPAKVPVALDMRDAFASARDGEIPDLGAVFERRGAETNAAVASLGDDLVDTVESTITRGFRAAFAISALLALLALVPALALRRPRLP